MGLPLVNGPGRDDPYLLLGEEASIRRIASRRNRGSTPYNLGKGEGDCGARRVY